MSKTEKTARCHRNKSGQSMLEYIMVVAMSLGIIVILGIFFVTFKEYGGRMMEIVSSEYP
jgi:hypothetical protein